MFYSERNLIIRIQFFDFSIPRSLSNTNDKTIFTWTLFAASLVLIPIRRWQKIEVVFRFALHVITYYETYFINFNSVRL